MHPPSILQLVLIIVLVLLLFGSRRVPEIMENLAKGIKSFKDNMKDDAAEKKKIPDKKKQDD